MAKFAVTVGGANYEVEAPDEGTAWKWANATHLQAIKNDPQQAPQQAVSPGLEAATQPLGMKPRDFQAELNQQYDVGRAPYELGAKVNDAAAKYFSAPVAAGLGAAANAGMEGAGMLAGGGIGTAAGLAAKAPVQDTAKWLMQKALKPSITDFRRGKGDRAIETLLEEGVNVSRGGVEKLRGMGEELNRKVGAEIAGSTARVDLNAANPALADTAQFFRKQVNPQDDLAAVDAARTKFFTHPDLFGRADIPVQLAQELKQGTQRQLKDKYGQLSNADEQAQKALAAMLRQEIEKGVPSVGPLNKRASDIWNALNVTERRAFVGGNNNPVSLPTAVGMIHNPAFGAGMVVNTSDLAKSLMARMLYTGGKGAPYLGQGAGMASVLMDNE